MSYNDRREYLTATVLDQDFLDRCQDNTEFKFEMSADIEAPDGMIYISDRHKYVGGRFYRALTVFPAISRNIGEWLSPEIEFSSLQIVISNVDGRFNKYLPGGAAFAGWLNKQVTIRLGLRDVESTYFQIYSGRVTEVGGFQRDRAKIILKTRDEFDLINRDFPTQVLSQDAFPDLDDALVGTVVPVIYGDYTVALRTTKLNPSEPSSPTADVPVVPAYPTNGKNTGVLAGTTALRLVVAPHALSYFDTAGVYLKRGEVYYPLDAADITLVTDNRVFDIRQGGSGGTSVVEGVGYQYASGDLILVTVKGKTLGGYDDNPVWQARDILVTHGGLDAGMLDANWSTFRDKAAPAQSAIATTKSRVWVQKPQGAVSYALSLLEQVRLEAFVSRDQTFKLCSLHFEDFPAAPSYTIRNWDIEEGTLTPEVDEQNNWNRAAGSYNRDPSSDETTRETVVYRNQAAIDQMGKQISKKLVFPNLYEESTVVLNLIEMLKLASGNPEMISVTLTPRSALRDIGDFVKLNVNLGSIVLQNVPAMIRQMGFDPQGLRIPVRLWSWQMTPYPGYVPAYPGTTGGYNATITAES